MPRQPTKKKRHVQRQLLVDLDGSVREYLTNRSLRERAEHIEGALRKSLMELLAEDGEEQEGGHKVLPLSAAQAFVSYKAGKAQQKTIGGIKSQRRVSQRLDQDEAMALVKRKKLTDKCITTIQVLDEDALLAANFTGEITDAELAALYTDVETFAFYLVEGEPDE